MIEYTCGRCHVSFYGLFEFSNHACIAADDLVTTHYGKGEEADLYQPYALIVLNDATEYQERVVSLDYAGLVYLRNTYRAQGYTANLRVNSGEDAVWDFLEANVAADVAGYLKAAA